ncbi:MAG: DNA methyltransferase [Armatimonadota bacterium]
MKDCLTTEVNSLLRQACKVLEDIVQRTKTSGVEEVEELLRIRTKIQEAIAETEFPDQQNKLSVLDESINKSKDIIIAVSDNKLENIRAKMNGQHLDWWWYLDRDRSVPVQWALEDKASSNTSYQDDISTLRIGHSTEPRDAHLTLQLMNNAQFIYELNLARLELSALNHDPEVEVLSDLRRIRTRHNPKNENMLRNRLAYFRSVNMEDTVYFSLQSYNITRSVNQYLTHWFYPYKGKFHPQVVRALLNILQVKREDSVLDLFSGVGTTAVESMLLGINTIGVDISHVATRVARAKVEAWRYIDKIKEQLNYRLENPPLDAINNDEQQYLLDQGAIQWCEDDEVDNFYIVAALIAVSDTGRRRRDFIGSYQERCMKMLESIDLMKKAIEDHGISIGKTNIYRGDARKLSIDDESIDAIITSPPYSIALNYVENDKHALQALGLSLDTVKEDYIGVRGSGQAKLEAYNQDMRTAISEMTRVLKPGGRCAIIIGNPKFSGKPIEADRLVDRYCQDAGLQILEDRGLDLSHRIPKTVYGLYNMITEEQILLFKKPGIKKDSVYEKDL